jgi:hypothetical protein
MLRCLGDQRIEVAQLPGHLERAGFDARHIEQIVNQPAQPVTFIRDDLQELAAGWYHPSCTSSAK